VITEHNDPAQNQDRERKKERIGKMTEGSTAARGPLYIRGPRRTARNLKHLKTKKRHIHAGTEKLPKNHPTPAIVAASHSEEGEEMNPKIRGERMIQGEQLFANPFTMKLERGTCGKPLEDTVKDSAWNPLERSTEGKKRGGEKKATGDMGGGLKSP